jgi:ACR3 family arsenite efflux pump ArsB
MSNILKALIALSCLAFIIAAFGSMFGFDFLGTDPEGFSRASNNLALIAIALAVCFTTENKKGDTS